MTFIDTIFIGLLVISSIVTGAYLVMVLRSKNQEELLAEEFRKARDTED